MYKAICAYMVLLYHICQRINASIFIYFGYLGVSGFFFISGYGMTLSWGKQKEKYAKKIMFVKIPQIISVYSKSLYFQVECKSGSENDKMAYF